MFLSRNKKTFSCYPLLFGAIISYMTACMPSQDADQPVHLCSLIILHRTLWVAKDPLHLQMDSEDSVYNVDPLKPHFCIEKLGFTGVYIIFLISNKKHRLWVLVGTASSRQF